MEINCYFPSSNSALLLQEKTGLKNVSRDFGKLLLKVLLQKDILDQKFS